MSVIFLNILEDNLEELVVIFINLFIIDFFFARIYLISKLKSHKYFMRIDLILKNN